MRKFRETGAAVEIDNFNDDADAALPRWYLPLHVNEKKFPKTRICHDARASIGGVCLNDFLLGGPNMINPLIDILLNFRIHRYAFMTDIKDFFHQIRVHPKDVKAFRYLWFADESMKTAVVELFFAHIFGSAASSGVSSFTL